MANINRVVLVGNLTKDPELRHTPGGTLGRDIHGNAQSQFGCQRLDAARG